ncbi:MAG TPA: 3-hydroxyacyl-CoA dehydrogenase family protein [Bacteroidetes bacterium]|nr:3-hydroxyacyl-CoA dehydrogenase family protein [Bacteroidota bacterium]
MNPLEQFSLRQKLIPKGKIQAIGIVGCGTVGQNIALHSSRYGLDVIFIDVSQERIKQIFTDLEKQLDDVITHWGITPSEKLLVLSRIKGSTNYKDLKSCDLIIETFSSRKLGPMIEERQEIFQKIEKAVNEKAIISSNLSTLMISDLATVLKHPGRAIGIHFIDPIDQTNIVELVKGVRTTDESFEKARRFVRMIGKKPIKVNESPGNISIRMIIPLINEACEILMEGVATVEDIDETMRESSGHRTGPFELADRIGLDKVMKYMDNLYAEFGNSKYKASPVIKRLVRANYLGRINGKGFYNYEGNKPVSNISITIIN